MQPFNFCEVYYIIILRLCSFKLCRVFLLTKCFVIGEKWLWNVLLDCFQLPGKSVFSEHKHARNVALKWLIIIIISLGQILLSYIANTSRTNGRTHTHAHAPARTRAVTYNYSMGLCRPTVTARSAGDNSWSLVMEINTGTGGLVSPRFWVWVFRI